MKKITRIFLCVCVFALTLLCAAGCAPGSFDIEGTSRELRLNGFVYRSLEGAQATGNYYTDSFANSFGSQEFYNYLFVNSRNYEFSRSTKRLPKPPILRQSTQLQTRQARFWNFGTTTAGKSNIF